MTRQMLLLMIILFSCSRSPLQRNLLEERLRHKSLLYPVLDQRLFLGKVLLLRVDGPAQAPTASWGGSLWDRFVLKVQKISKQLLPTGPFTGFSLGSSWEKATVWIYTHRANLQGCLITSEISLPL